MIPDISHWHPVKDWSQLKRNCAFVISKATEGTSYIDPTLTSFINGCEKYGIPYFLYSFLRKGNELAQAKYMVSVCKPKVGKFFKGYVLDVECGNSASGVQAALRWLEKNTSTKCVLYTMFAQYSTYSGVIRGRAAKTAWWEARYGKNNGVYSPQYSCHEGADLHQFTSNGCQPGVGTGTDLSRLTGTKPLTWFVGGTKTGAGTKAKKEKSAGIVSRRKLLRLVANTMRGKYGAGETRKKRLGKYYEPVMAMINHIDKARTVTLVTETLRGAYGTGRRRKAVLGRRYMEVQAIINVAKNAR